MKNQRYLQDDTGKNYTEILQVHKGGFEARIERQDGAMFNITVVNPKEIMEKYNKRKSNE